MTQKTLVLTEMIHNVSYFVGVENNLSLEQVVQMHVIAYSLVFVYCFVHLSKKYKII